MEAKLSTRVENAGLGYGGKWVFTTSWPRNRITFSWARYSRKKLAIVGWSFENGGRFTACRKKSPPLTSDLQRSLLSGQSPVQSWVLLGPRQVADAFRARRLKSGGSVYPLNMFGYYTELGPSRAQAGCRSVDGPRSGHPLAPCRL
jgi:hypothetical protein